MKRILVFCLLLALPAAAVDVRLTFSDLLSRPVANKTLTLYPVSVDPTNAAGEIVTQDRVSTNTLLGSIIISNLVGGEYRSELRGPSTVTTNYFNFPSAGFVDAKDYISVPIDSQLAYSKTAADVRFLRPTSQLYGSNIVGEIPATLSGRIDITNLPSVGVFSNATGSVTLLDGSITPTGWIYLMNERYLQGRTAQQNSKKLIGLSSANALMIGDDAGAANDYIDFLSNAGLVGFVDAAGNWGLGNASPQAKLDVTGTVRAQGFSGNGATLTNLAGSVNVLDFGADPTGIADSSSAFQKAADAQQTKNPGSSADVIIPPGSYRLDSSIQETNPIVFRGVGKPTISFRGDGFAFVLGRTNLVSSYNGNYEVHGLTFECDGEQADGSILFRRWNQGTIVRACHFIPGGATNANFTHIVFDGDNWEAEVSDCKFRSAVGGNENNCIDLNRSSSVNSTQARILNNYFGGTSKGYGLRIFGAGAQVEANAFGGRNPAILLVGGDGTMAHSARIVGNYFEAHTNDVLRFSGTLEFLDFGYNYANVHSEDYSASNALIGPINTDTTNAMRWCSFNHNVIIGCTNPVIRLTAATGQIGNVMIGNTVTRGPDLAYAVLSTWLPCNVASAVAALTQDSNGWNASQPFAIPSALWVTNNNVGLGVTNPPEKLTLSYASKLAWAWGSTLPDSTFTWITKSNAAASLTFYAGATDTETVQMFNFTTQARPQSVLSILNGGNVGIGVYTPLSKLDVAGDIRASTYVSATNGFYFMQGTNTAPTAANIGGTVGSVTNHLMKNVGGKLMDYWSDGTTLWSKQLAP